ncbi:MAG TPA: hypothetical protein PK156_27260, partial [Polyangium sp.]|nr:hypothetical protein [Polyangium sp.]
MTTTRTPCLIPLQVNACVIDPQTLSRTKDVVQDNGSVRASPHAWAWHMPNYDKLDARRNEAFDRVWPQLFESIPPPESFARGGVCLSVAPPSGFSKPIDDEDPHSLPRLPDRWLWVRILRRTHDTAGRSLNETPRVSAWIIDAGVRTDNPESAPLLTTSKGRMRACRVGVQRSLAEALRHGPDEPRVPLHIQGTDESASVTFAAFAPANLNNVSCIDTLEDVSPEDLRQSVLSYFVMGWYRDAEHDDPLLKEVLAGKTAAEIRRNLHLDDENVPDVSFLGNRCIFHGLVGYVDYWNPRSYLGPAFGSPQAEPVHPCTGTMHHEPQKIGFGATTEEALAALIADIDPQNSQNPQLSETFYRLLKTLLFDRMDMWDAMGADDMMRHAERDMTFHSVAASSEWIVGPAEGSDAFSTAEKTTDLTPEQQALLQSLNDLQKQADETNHSFQACCETLYTAWWQTIRARGRRKAMLDDNVTQRTREARSLEDERNRLRSAVESARNKLQASIDSSMGRGAAKLESTSTKWFYLPKEPAVAIRNVGTQLPPFPEQTRARSVDLVARERARGDYERLQRAPIRETLRAYRDPFLDPVFDALAEEAALIEEAIASLMRDGGRTPIFDQNSDISQWEQRNARVLDRAGLVEFSTTNGKNALLSPSAQIWLRQPWVPLFLDWEVEWFPTTEVDDIHEGTLLNGRTILASRPQNLILSRLGRMESMSTNMANTLATCRHLFDDMTTWDVLAQSLSGFHQQLLLRDDLLPRVLPPDEPLRHFVEQTSLGPPNISPNLEFDALRRGSVRIRRVWVVDSFGQASALDPTVNSALAATGPQQSFRLGIRLLEPSRLAVNLENAPQMSHPVRAWILPSLADKALVVYDGSGKPLGMISRLAAVNALGTSWRPALARAPKRPEEIADPVLAAFLTPLVGGPEAFSRFESLMRHVDYALARTAPSARDTSSPASMLGRPLVLLQARVAIERRGGPIEDPTLLYAGSLEP